MLTVCREPADGCRLNRCTRVLDARVADTDTDMVELVYETSGRQRPRDAAPSSPLTAFPTFPFTQHLLTFELHNGEYKPASIDDGHSDVIIT